MDAEFLSHSRVKKISTLGKKVCIEMINGENEYLPFKSELEASEWVKAFSDKFSYPEPNKTNNELQAAEDFIKSYS